MVIFPLALTSWSRALDVERDDTSRADLRRQVCSAVLRGKLKFPSAYKEALHSIMNDDDTVEKAM